MEYLEVKAFRLEVVCQLAKQLQCVATIDIVALYQRAILPFDDLCTIFDLLAVVCKFIGWWLTRVGGVSSGGLLGSW